MRAKVGTPDYMAPELLLGSTHGIAVDLWALGCVSFELLTGYPPFTGDSVEEVFEHVLEHTHAEHIRWPEEEGHLSPEAISFIRQMLSSQPELRPGASNGVAEIASHPLFAGINWDDLRMRSVRATYSPPTIPCDLPVSWCACARVCSATGILVLAGHYRVHARSG